MHAAVDWLLGRQDGIEAELARDVREGGMALFDLSSSWVDGPQCELAAFGHSRGKRGKPQTGYGLLAIAEPVNAPAGAPGAPSPRPLPAHSPRLNPGPLT